MHNVGFPVVFLIKAPKGISLGVFIFIDAAVAILVPLDWISSHLWLKSSDSLNTI